MKMFNKKALANSLAVLSGLFYVVLYLLSVVAPTTFMSIFNAQFLGADIASLVPSGFSIGVLVVVFLTSWVVGYVWAMLYNNFSK